MKRIFLFFFTAVLVGSLFIVPALAADSLTFSTAYVNGDAIPLVEPLIGYYVVNFYYSNGDLAFALDAADFTWPNAPMYYISYDGVILEFYWGYDDYYDYDVLKLFVSAGGCDDNKCGAFSAFFPDVTTFEFVPAVVDPVVPSEPEAPSEPIVPVVPPVNGSALSGVLDVFSGIGSWIAGQLGAATSLFWNAGTGSFTFIGVLSVCGLALAVVLLLIMVVIRFLRFRG